MRKIKFPEVIKEKAEATLMVLFASPLQRFGLFNAQTNKHRNKELSFWYKEAILHSKQDQVERSPIVSEECRQCEDTNSEQQNQNMRLKTGNTVCI